MNKEEWIEFSLESKELINYLDEMLEFHFRFLCDDYSFLKKTVIKNVINVEQILYILFSIKMELGKINDTVKDFFEFMGECVNHGLNPKRIIEIYCEITKAGFDGKNAGKQLRKNLIEIKRRELECNAKL